MVSTFRFQVFARLFLGCCCAGALVGAGVRSRLARAEEFSFDPTFPTFGEEVTLNWTMWLPDDMPTVRGLVFIPGPQVSTRQRITVPYLQRAARALGFGLVGNDRFLGNTPDLWAGETAEETQQIVQSVLDAAAAASGHPELENVPIATIGSSASGGQSTLIAARVPSRVLAFASLRAGFVPPGHPFAQATEGFPRVPGVFLLGSEDDDSVARRQPAFEDWRQQEDAHFANTVVWGSGHTPDDLATADGRYRGLSWEMGWYWLAEAIRLRYPADELPSVMPGDPLVLQDIDTDAGWLAESPSFVPELHTSTDPDIYPAPSYPGNVGKASWLPSEGAANAYRAVTAIADRQYIPGSLQYPGPMTFASPSNLLDPSSPTYMLGDAIPIRIDPHEFDDDLAITEMEFFDGARRIGSDTQGPDWEILYTPDEVGIHGLTAVATNETGTRSYSFRAVPVVPWTGRRTLVESPTAIYSVVDDDSDSVHDNLGDFARDESQRGLVSIGELDTASENQLVRLVAKFALPELEPRLPTVENATLRFYVDKIEGPPPGALSLLHSVTDNDLDLVASDYEEATYTDTTLDLVSPIDAPKGYYELDVTDLVRTDYAADGDSRLSAFRLQIDESAFVEDGQSHRYTLQLPGVASRRPELVLTFVPEPATWSLATIALLWFAGRTIPRGCKRHN